MNIHMCVLLSHVWLFAIPWTPGYSPWDFPGKNTGAGCHDLLQRNLPDLGIEPRSPALQAHSLPSEPPGKPWKDSMYMNSSYVTKGCVVSFFFLRVTQMHIYQASTKCHLIFFLTPSWYVLLDFWSTDVIPAFCFGRFLLPDLVPFASL